MSLHSMDDGFFEQVVGGILSEKVVVDIANGIAKSLFIPRGVGVLLEVLCGDMFERVDEIPAEIRRSLSA